MNPVIPETKKITNYFVIFLIVSGQLGTAVLGFQRIVLKSVGFDAWISIFIGGVMVHLFLYMIYAILKRGNGDIIYIHKQLFGKWIGGTFSFIILLYALLGSITVLRTYIEIVQVWMFPRLNIWFFTFVFLLLVYYAISGGFRVVAGIAQIAVMVLLLMLPVFLFALQFANFQNMLPIMKHSIGEIFGGVKAMSLSYSGFESVLLFYPFLKGKSQKWAHFGVGITMIIYLYIGIISFAFYSEGQLSRTIWGTLSLFKIVEMPFLERFEYIGVSIWAIIALSNILISLWICGYGSKRLFSVNEHKALILILVIVYFIINFINSRITINTLNDYTAQIGLYILILYIPFVYLFQTFKQKLRGSENK
jgi:spore germination protein AB